jgi:AraC-like DNA-binding protein
MWSLVTATLCATLLAAGFLDFLLYDWLTTLAIGSALFFFTWNAVVHIDDSIPDHVFEVRNVSQSTSEGWPDLIVDCDITCTPADEAFRWINPALPVITEEEMMQQRWHQKLDETMTEQYLWKESELSSEQVANRIGLTESRLQKLIKNQSRCSFFDYVNRKRVTEIKRSLAQRRSSAIDYNQLAIDSGFENQKAMNRVFVRETGTSPKTFRRLSS